MATPASKQPACPICRRPVGQPADNASFPFCSDRCKVIDLSKWLSNEYSIPAHEEDDGDATGPGEDEGAERLH